MFNKHKTLITWLCVFSILVLLAFMLTITITVAPFFFAVIGYLAVIFLTSITLYYLTYFAVLGLYDLYSKQKQRWRNRKGMQ